MTTSIGERIQAIVSLAKCETSIIFKPHTVNYETVAQFLEQYDDEDVPPNIRAACIEHDSIVQIYCYASTPVGNYMVIHHDLDEALNIMLGALS